MMFYRTALFDKQSAGKTWYGGDIESAADRDEPPEERYDSGTDKLSIWLGKQFNLSPKKINDILKSSTGIIGKAALPPLTTEATPNLIEKAFTLDPVFSNELSQKFYDKINEYQQNKNSDSIGIKDKTTAKLVYRYMNKQNSMVADIRKEIELISS